MTKTYRITPITRVANGIFSVMTRRGRGANYRYILTVEGRKSGVAKSTPVDVMEVDGQRWLVAPYGEVNWVKNARALPSAIRNQLDQSWRLSFHPRARNGLGWVKNSWVSSLHSGQN